MTLPEQEIAILVVWFGMRKKAAHSPFTTPAQSIINSQRSARYGSCSTPTAFCLISTERNSSWRKSENHNIWQMKTNKHRGSNFEAFLKEEGMLEAVELKALKRALALKLKQAMTEKTLSKTQLALRMKTSRAALDRLLDSSNTSVTLSTLDRAAHALGRKLKIELIPA
jgi:DNA-binding Xre family transcriptional regulator